MRTRTLVIAALAAVLAVLTAGCGGGGSNESAPPSGTTAIGETSGGETSDGETQPAETQEGGEIVEGGILRIGTTNNIDSLNPFNAFNSQAYIAFIMQYPMLTTYDENFELVGDWAESWETSPDGLTWTFKVKTGQWSDGQPLTAEDGAWTINTVVKYQDGPTSYMAPPLTHVAGAEAPTPDTLVITYEQPVANVLPQLQQFYILPKHIWEQHTGNSGKDLKSFDPGQSLPSVSAGPFVITKYEKKGITLYERNPSYYGEQKPYVDAVGVQYFTNADALAESFRNGELDYLDTGSVPPNAVDALKSDSNVQVITAPGAENTNVIFNSNPDKPEKRELLDPQVRLAFEHAINREEIAEVVFNGLAKPTVSLIAPDAGEWMNPDLETAPFDIEEANRLLDAAGYARGSDGVRVTPDGGKMEYEVITPNDVNFNINREFEIIQAGLDQVGVKVTQKAFDNTTAFEEIGAPDWKYLDFDLAMWDWVGYKDPDFMLSVVTCGQYGGWSDSGYCNADYDQMYEQQGVTIDPEERKQIVWEMQDILNRDKPYIQLVNMELIGVGKTNWAGFQIELEGYAKSAYTNVHQIG